ncbi:MAG: 23S rRNA (adenine(2503)-C(2))-methyltransferase RlmN [Desulfobacteraceae bacterium]|nr:23S rRNA (adenine(2503)-C(2))-methyltransferase RlmN [Desulfobacteraceae bacterium]
MEILDFTLDQLTYKFEVEFGKGLYHASALYREIFKFGNPNFLDVKEFAASPALARQLKNRISLSPGQVVETFNENNLTKFITQFSDGEKIESVIIPMTNHQTLCVSSQIGCKMGCRFCETGKMGFKKNLLVHQITGQLYNARFVLKKRIKNIVFMGMGEPFDNFNNVIQAIQIMNEQKGFDIALRYITISTVGLTSEIEKLGRLNMPGLRLAISINAPDNRTRSWLMPINKTVSLQDLKKVLKNFPLTKRGGFLFEYILIKGLNDSSKDAIRLAEYIKPLPVKLNLIPYNPIKGFRYDSPCDDDMNSFANVLTDKGVFVIKRWSKGYSLAAGCGQLGNNLGGL